MKNKTTKTTPAIKLTATLVALYMKLLAANKTATHVGLVCDGSVLKLNAVELDTFETGGYLNTPHTTFTLLSAKGNKVACKTKPAGVMTALTAEVEAQVAIAEKEAAKKKPATEVVLVKTPLHTEPIGKNDYITRALMQDKNKKTSRHTKPGLAEVVAKLFGCTVQSAYNTIGWVKWNRKRNNLKTPDFAKAIRKTTATKKTATKKKVTAKKPATRKTTATKKKVTAKKPAKKTATKKTTTKAAA